MNFDEEWGQLRERVLRMWRVHLRAHPWDDINVRAPVQEPDLAMLNARINMLQAELDRLKAVVLRIGE